MRKIAIVAVVPLMLLAVLVFTSPASAASVEEVVAACDKMDAAKPGSCRYTTDDKGLGGCTRNGCFYCPADGSRQCHADGTDVDAGPAGRKRAGWDIVDRDAHCCGRLRVVRGVDGTCHEGMSALRDCRRVPGD